MAYGNIKYFTISLFCVLFVSCNVDQVDYNFKKLATIKGNNYETIFPEFENLGGGNQNRYYKKLLSYGKNSNEYLLEKAVSDKETNWYNYPFYFRMTEGDIAIELLIKINNIEFFEILPYEITNEYKTNGAKIWWVYLHNNRQEILKLIKENIK